MPDPADISVVIPAYNREKTIARAIESILAGSVRPGEILVCDDGSTDRTVETASRFGEPVRIVVRENGGPSAARNTGVAHARGKWIAFLDSDDCYPPSKLETQCRALEAFPHARVLMSNGSIRCGTQAGIDRSDVFAASGLHIAKPTTMQHGELTPYLCENLSCCAASLLLERALWDELGGMDESMWWAEDVDLFMRLSLAESILLDPAPVWITDYTAVSSDQLTHTTDYIPGFFAYFVRIGQKCLRQFPDMPLVARDAISRGAQRSARPLLEYHVSVGDRKAALSVWHQAVALDPRPTDRLRLAALRLFTLPAIGRKLHSLLRPARRCEAPQRSGRITVAIWEARSA